jgi:DNA-binding transcriptional LysR family regulator
MVLDQLQAWVGALLGEPDRMISKLNLDTALLRTLTTVVELGSFMRAGERLGRSQPALSLQMKKLEETLGLSLFKKDGRKFALTEAGDTLLTYARRLLELNDEAVSAVHTMKVSGSIRLGIPEDLAEGWLTQVLARFSRAHPSVLIEVKADRNAVLTDLLARQRLDLALMFGESENSHALRVGRVPIVWVGAKQSIEASESIPLIVFEPPCRFRQAAIEALDRAGLGWRLTFSSPSLSSQWAAVEAGLGISIRTPIGLPKTVCILRTESHLPNLDTIDLLLYRANDQPDSHVQRLEDILIETIRERLESDFIKPPLRLSRKRRH